MNDALHKMSTQAGVIAWDVIWGCVIFSFIFVFILYDSDWNFKNIYCLRLHHGGGSCIASAVLVKRSFIKRMIRNSLKRFPTEVQEGYAELVASSLKRGVLSYGKELILTDNYILGVAEDDMRFIPAAWQKRCRRCDEVEKEYTE